MNQYSMAQSKRHFSVFVGDISFFCTELDLAKLFIKFGNIVGVEIKRGRYGDSLLHGFVEYDRAESAEAAIAAMHGVRFMGRTMRVNCTNIKPGPNPDIDKWVQVHYGFVCRDVNKLVNEEFLESVFSFVGPVADVTIKRHGCTGSPPHVAGYGFVYYYDLPTALRAMREINGAIISELRFECSLSHRACNAVIVASANSPSTVTQFASASSSPSMPHYNHRAERATASPRFHAQGFLPNKVSPPSHPHRGHPSATDYESERRVAYSIGPALQTPSAHLVVPRPAMQKQRSFQMPPALRGFSSFVDHSFDVLPGDSPRTGASSVTAGSPHFTSRDSFASNSSTVHNDWFPEYDNFTDATPMSVDGIAGDASVMFPF